MSNKRKDYKVLQHLLINNMIIDLIDYCLVYCVDKISRRVHINKSTTMKHENNPRKKLQYYTC